MTSESDRPVKPDQTIPLQVASWFSTNTFHPKVHPLPLGLGNSYCDLTAKAPQLADVRGAPKTGLLFINFRVRTNDSIRRPLWESYEQAERDGWAMRRTPDDARGNYLKDLAAHQFVLCPQGNGVDTHRMWEALYAGTIPVVQRNQALDFFADLPILFVDNLTGLTRQVLVEQAERMSSLNDWNWPKLFLPWWREKFENAKASAEKLLSWRRFIIGRGARFLLALRAR